MNNSNYKDVNASLPMMALDEIPTPNSNALKIVALVKDGGHVSGYKLEDNTILDKEAAIKLAKSGGIKGVGIANRKGNPYLKSLPDGSENNNLGNLPSVSRE